MGRLRQDTGNCTKCGEEQSKRKWKKNKQKYTFIEDARYYISERDRRKANKPSMGCCSKAVSCESLYNNFSGIGYICVKKIEVSELVPILGIGFKFKAIQLCKISLRLVQTKSTYLHILLWRNKVHALRTNIFATLIDITI